MVTVPRMLCNGNGAFSHLQTEMGFIEDFRYSMYNSKKCIFCPIWNLLYENKNLKKEISRNILYNPPMGCFPLANSHFQMGVTVMGFAEHFGLRHIFSCRTKSKAALGTTFCLLLLFILLLVISKFVICR